MQSATPTLLTFPDVYVLYGSGRSKATFRLWLWRAVRAGRFPAPLVMGPHTRAWRREDLERWEASLQPVSYAPPPPAAPIEAA